MSDVTENVIINDIITKVSNDLEKYLKNINLSELLELKKENTDYKIRINTIEEKNKQLLEEMNNFKKVSLLNTITNQIEEKNKEVTTLNSIIKSRDTTINQLKVRIENVENKINNKPNNLFDSNILEDGDNGNNSKDDNSDNSDNSDNICSESNKNENVKNKCNDNQINYNDNESNDADNESNDNEITQNISPEFQKKKLKGVEYYFHDNKLYIINSDLSQGKEVGLYMTDKKKYKFYK